MYRTIDIIDPPILEIKSKLLGLCKSEKLLDLSQAVPSYPMPERIKEGLIKDFSDSFSFYTPDQGLIELREAIVGLHSDNKVKINPAQVLISAGANQGAFNVFTTLFKSGDKVAIPVPYYFNYDMALRILGVEPVYYTLDKNNGFKFKFSELDITILDECKGIIVINPNNPTGAEYEPEELKKLYSACVSKKVTLISDEAYGFFSKNGYPSSSMLNIVDDMDNLVVINTFSKTFSLTGFRVAYTLAKEDIIEQILKVQDTVIICAPRISQKAALIGLEHCKDWLTEKVSFIGKNVEQFKEFAEQELKRFSVASVGSFFAYIEHPYKNKNSREIAHMLAEKANILSLPASIFGAGQESFIRLAFGNLKNRQQIIDLVERLKELERLY